MKNLLEPRPELLDLARLDLVAADLQTLARLPTIRRHRDFHAYSFSGTRYLDLWRNDGFCLLGYSIPGFQLAIKNRISQALWGAAPHPLQKQLKKSLERFFPAHHSFVCSDREAVRSVLNALGVSVNRPLLPRAQDMVAHNAGNLGFWLPFTSLPEPSSVSIALLPIAGIAGPLVLLIPHDESSGAARPRVLDFISGLVPPYQVAALHSSLLAIAALGAFASAPAHGVRTRDLSQKLGVWDESSWQNIETGNWQRVGPYLRHQFSAKAYHQVCVHAIEKGIILNPRSQGLNYLPGLLSNGEKRILESIFSFVPEGDA